MRYDKYEPETLQEAIAYFEKPENCVRYLVARRWPDGVVCPVCGSKDVSYVESRSVWQCKTRHEKCQFSVKVGTIFEDSALPLKKWLAAMWMIANCKNGISSWEIHRALKITQKTAWFVLHRIRCALQSNPTRKLGGPGSEVEVDETFVGGKAKNMHRKVAMRHGIPATGYGGKTVVVGILERGKEVRASLVPSRGRKILQAEIAKHVAPGSHLSTDNFMSYDHLPSHYFHEFVDHAAQYVRGRVHTNGLENFWSLFKRGVRGTYVSIEPYHLQAYLDEQVFRYNNRATPDRPMKDADRFSLAVSRIVGKRLTYAKLTGKVGETMAQPN
jgi:transposase-like protein